ncbi:DnaJ domain-containing protein [Candidatus Babela massiliensis]|uniref:DnaJ-domain containing protein n=1 Tax=Candidatus Babela massiliensis TaxID=673862 RepID=V6DJV0_9BACT|nr:DnaJ domain-containing protein [Candidatus Babela massiliensis]CDK30791.1 DnaJ-domain containing protein [Candidatus Babela massiliensis]
MRNKYIFLLAFIFLINNMLAMKTSGPTLISRYLSGNITSDKFYEISELRPWEVLGISPQARPNIIKKSYQKLVRAYHPDKNSETKANDIFKAVQNAYERLTGTEKKFIPEESAKSAPNFDILREDVRKNQKQYQSESKNKDQKIYNQDLLFNIHVNIIWDSFNVLNEINKIRVLGSFNEKSILNAANVDGILHSSSPMFIKAKINIFLDYINNMPTQNIYVQYARAMSLIYPFVDIYFLKKDREISKEAERISKYNKETGRNLSKTKFVQYSWLLFNKIAPYMAFALSRKNNENVGFIDTFKNTKKLTLSSYERFEVVKGMAHVSEILRKLYRYIIEYGDYKKFNFDVNK